MILLLPLVLLASGPALASADEPSAGSIVGRVVDAEGAPLAGVGVRAVQFSGPGLRLPPARGHRYSVRVTVSRPGYRTATRTSVAVRIGQG